MIMWKMAYASIDENGKARGGKAGNQTGKELKIRDVYDFGQNLCIRCLSKSKRIKGAKIAKSLALNSAIGYNQDKRYQLYNLASNCGWSFTKLKKELKKTSVNCDCSSFASTVINLTFGKRIVGCCTTWTITDCIDGIKNAKAIKYFDVINYKLACKKFWRFDMALKQGKHITILVK